MIRTCPKCGDYYADALLAFCLVDGTPLINVAPDRVSWSNVAQVIEAKERTLKKRKHKLKLRRIVVSTMALATLVMLLVAVNASIYIESVPKKEIVSQPSIPEAGPVGGSDSVIETTSVETSPAPSPNPTATPKTTTIATETPTPEITPLATPTPKHTPTPTPTPTQTPTTTPTIFSAPGNPPECSIADQRKEENAITGKFGAEWRRRIEGHPPQVKTEKQPAGVANANLPVGIIKPTLILGAIEYQSLFSPPCTAVVTASYLWQVTVNFNGNPKVVGQIAGQKRFTCVKTGETWSCR